MAELEQLMVPAAVRQGFRDGGAFPIDPRPPLSGCRVSKFTTGLISTSGCVPIENNAWKVASEDHPANHNNMELPHVGGDVEFVGYDDLPGRLAKMNASKKLEMTKTELDSVLEELTEVEETPLIDPKYFDVASYLIHVQTADERQAQIRASQFFAHTDATGDLEELSYGSDTEAANNLPPTTSTDRLRKRIAHDHVDITDATESISQPDICHESDMGNERNLATVGLTKSNPVMLVQDSAGQRSQFSNGLIKKTDEANVEAGAPTISSGFASDQKGKWELLQGSTDMPRVGQPAPEKLTIRLRRKDSGETETHIFQNPSTSIDWNDKKDIEEVSTWRSQVFRSRGFIIVKSSNYWLPIETSWLILFHKKVKGVIEAGHLVKLPGPAFVVDAFNDFFEGKILQDAAGADLPAREARDEISLKAKLAQHSSGIKPMRDTMRKLLEGRSGAMVYVPKITEGEFDRYLQDGTVLIDNAVEVDRPSSQPRLRASPKRKREIKDVIGIEEKRAKR
ncbi:hypothetical protein FB567DRAFT_587820 [Paraphoma chrysanthemicola]|uniref:Uncharacterized protein n=1 Tax=Paraphoma chrysanthemicola TaxID=798071 RepID=A0A8K0RHH1_9PLEO|nr:hypothetical protein FB567DRAFT_587820 [Paraphoma chrysanthemicola]